MGHAVGAPDLRRALPYGRVMRRILEPGNRAFVPPTGVVAGELDPGGRFWVVSLATWALLALVVKRLLRGRRRPGNGAAAAPGRGGGPAGKGASC